MKIILFLGSGWLNNGDALRELESRSDLRPRTDFIIVSSGSIFNLNLYHLTKQHKARRSIDKNWLLTCIFHEGIANNRKHSSFHLVIDPNTNQLLKYYVPSFHKLPKHYSQLLNTTNETVFVENVELNASTTESVDDFVIDMHCSFHEKSMAVIEVKSEVISSGIFICGSELLVEFRENFDYAEIVDYIRGKLDSGDAELLGNKMYAYFTHTSKNSEAVTCVSSIDSYVNALRDVRKRWFYPITPESVVMLRSASGREKCLKNNEKIGQLSYFRGGNYKCARVSLSVAEMLDCVVLDGVEIGGNRVRLENSVVGEHCRIGEGSVILDSVVFGNVEVGEKCEILGAVVFENVKIGDCVRIESGCVIGSGVELQDNAVVESGKWIGTEESVHRVKEQFLQHFDEDDREVTLLNEQWKHIEIKQNSSNLNNTGRAVEFPGILISDPFCDGNRASITTRNMDWGILIDDSSSEDEQQWHKEDTEMNHEDDDDVNASQLDLEGNEGDSEENEVETGDRFREEMIETIHRAIVEKHSYENAVLEVNSLKLVYEKSFCDCAKIITYSILETCERNESMKLFMENVNVTLNEWSGFILKFAQKQDEQLCVLEGIHEFMTKYSDAEMNAMYPAVLQVLYNEDIIDDENVFHIWADALTDTESRNAINPFLHWLQDAEEASSSNED